MGGKTLDQAPDLRDLAASMAVPLAVVDNAMARAATAGRVVSIAEFRRRRQLALAVEQGTGQGQVVQARIAKARTLRLVLILAGCA